MSCFSYPYHTLLYLFSPCISIPSQSCGSLPFHFPVRSCIHAIFFYLSVLFIPPALITLYVWQSCHTFVVGIWSFFHISCCHTYHGKCTAQNKLFKRTWCLYASTTSDVVLLHCIQCWLETRVISVPVSNYLLQHCDNDSTAVHYITLEIETEILIQIFHFNDNL